MKFFSLLSNQGTAALETAICEQCYDHSDARNNAREKAFDDVNQASAFHDVTENEAITTCTECGVTRG